VAQVQLLPYMYSKHASTLQPNCIYRHCVGRPIVGSLPSSSLCNPACQCQHANACLCAPMPFSAADCGVPLQRASCAMHPSTCWAPTAPLACCYSTHPLARQATLQPPQKICWQKARCLGHTTVHDAQAIGSEAYTQLQQDTIKPCAMPQWQAHMSAVLSTSVLDVDKIPTGFRMYIQGPSSQACSPPVAPFRSLHCTARGRCCIGRAYPNTHWVLLCWPCCIS